MILYSLIGEFLKGWELQWGGLLSTGLPRLVLFTDPDPNNFSVHPSTHLPIPPIIYLSIRPAVGTGGTLYIHLLA